MEKTKIILLDLDDTLFNTEIFIESGQTKFELYEEVHEVLKKLAKITTLGILSQGVLAFQKKKLEETNIKAYFNEEDTHIAEVKAEIFAEVLNKYHGIGQVYFVEDRLDTLEKAKKTDPSIVAVWMKRGRYFRSQVNHIDFKPDHTITNLSELVSLVMQS